MAEVWDQVGSAREQCHEDLEHIRTACKQDHSKEALLECPDCYGRAIDRIRQRYLESANPEWFSGRRAFLADLDAALNAAKSLDLDPRKLDSLILDEKRRWYLENVRNSVIRVVAEESLGRETLMEMLESRHFALDALAGEIRHALEQDAAELDATRSLLDKLGSIPDPQEKQSALAEGLFGIAPGQSVADNERKYFDMLSLGIPARAVVEQMVEDRQASQGARDQEAKHRQRINDLQRARAAHELQKTRKTEDPAKQQSPERFYQPADCLACRRAPDLKDVISCGLCEAFEGMGVEMPSTGTWCSTKCYAETHEEHLETSPSHSCASGDACVRVTGKDIDMDAGSDNAHLCNECVNVLRKACVFCSPRCAESNFQRHRDEVHLPRRRANGITIEDQENLVVKEDDPTRYFPKDIRNHVTSLDDALRDLQRNTGIFYS